MYNLFLFMRTLFTLLIWNCNGFTHNVSFNLFKRLTNNKIAYTGGIALYKQFAKFWLYLSKIAKLSSPFIKNLTKKYNCVQRRNCSLLAISPFAIMFSSTVLNIWLKTSNSLYIFNNYWQRISLRENEKLLIASNFSSPTMFSCRLFKHLQTDMHNI